MLVRFAKLVDFRIAHEIAQFAQKSIVVYAVRGETLYRLRSVQVNALLNECSFRLRFVGCRIARRVRVGQSFVTT